MHSRKILRLSICGPILPFLPCPSPNAYYSLSWKRKGRRISHWLRTPGKLKSPSITVGSQENYISVWNDHRFRIWAVTFYMLCSVLLYVLCYNFTSVITALVTWSHTFYFCDNCCSYMVTYILINSAVGPQCAMFHFSYSGLCFKIYSAGPSCGLLTFSANISEDMLSTRNRG